ncbi:MAG: ABC transporter permease, partial [Planctomycetes bacterium]|nr:ABC transporter permease [Planctomycetota bacterium]
MNKALRIARREYTAQVRTKGFLIGLALAPVLACGGLVVMLLMKDRVDVVDQHLAIVDRSGVLAESLINAANGRNDKVTHDQESGKKIKPAFVLEVVAPNIEDPDQQRLELSNRVRNRELYAFLEIGPDVLHAEKKGAASEILYFTDNPLSQDMRQWLWGPINGNLHQMRAAESGFDIDEVRRITNRLNIETMGLVSMDESTGEVEAAERSNEAQAVFVPMGMMMMLFMMIMFGAMPLLSSTLEEKTRRVSELLLGSISPFSLMMGKLIGGVGVSLTSLTFYLVVGASVTTYLGVNDKVPYDLLPWMLVFLIAAIFMFGALLAAVGAACNEASETQSLMPFVMAPMMIPMFIWFPVVKEPLGNFATGMSLFPPFTPVLMMLRMSTPAGVPTWQPWVGLIGLIAFTLFSVWAGGRIFRVGILMQGQAPKIGQLIRWV